MKKLVVIMFLAVTIMLMGCSSKERTKQENLERIEESQLFPVYETKGEIDSETNEMGYLTTIQDAAFLDIFNYKCAVKNGQIYAFVYHTQNEQCTYEINVYDVEGTILRTIPLSYQNEMNADLRGYCKEIQIGEDDTIWLLLENVTKKAKSHVLRVSQEGTILQDILLDESSMDDEIGYMDLQQDSEGRMYTLSCERKKVLIINADGSIYGSISLENLPEQTDAVNPWYLVSSKKGEVYVVLVGEAGEDSSILYQLLPEQLELSGIAKTLPISHARLLGAGLEGDFLCTKNESLWEVSFDEKESVELLNWLEAGVDWNRGIVALHAADENTIIALANKEDVEDGSLYWITIKKMKEKEIAQKQSITVVSLLSSYDLQRRIAYFNRENAAYVVRLKEYCKDAYDKEACQKALEQLNEDIRNDTAGDILDLESLQGFACQREYRDELENLYDWILTDEQTKDLDFLPNLLEANEIDGALYSLIASVQIETMLARTALVGESKSLSLEEANHILNSNVGLELSANLSQEDFLYNTYCYNEGIWVNFQEKTCQFDSDSFEAYLEYANTLLLKSELENLEDNDWNKIYRGEVLLVPVTLSSTLLENYQVMEATIGEETSAVGFVTEQGNGSLFVPGIFLGMLADSQQRDAAWEFLKSFLSEEYQNELTMRFPVLESSIEYWFKHAAEENQWERRAGTEEYEVTYGTLTEVQLEKIRNLVYKVDKIENIDWNIYQIILKESVDYFAGVCTAKEVCQEIQNQVERYLAE